jgi:hypothetical protein
VILVEPLTSSGGSGFWIEGQVAAFHGVEELGVLGVGHLILAGLVGVGHRAIKRAGRRVRRIPGKADGDVVDIDDRKGRSGKKAQSEG